MRVIRFFKYQGTGNDFIMIDNRMKTFPKGDPKLVANLCHRRFGIGADGLILLEEDKENDFAMVYYNSDGNPSTMCGNGGRCIVAFAYKLGLIQKDETTFSAPDGLHRALFKNGMIHLQMQDVNQINKVKKGLSLNTGSPHYVEIVKNLPELDVKREGAKIRYGTPFNIEGINVNFVEPIAENRFKVRTYERGVEDETYSCGTGAVATAEASGCTTGASGAVASLASGAVASLASGTLVVASSTLASAMTMSSASLALVVAASGFSTST